MMKSLVKKIMKKKSNLKQKSKSLKLIKVKRKSRILKKTKKLKSNSLKKKMTPRSIVMMLELIKF